MTSSSKEFQGLIAAAFTPMKEDGALNLRSIETLAEHLVRAGVTGVFVCGTTGESMSLAVTERMTIVEAWRQVCRRSLNLFVHVGHTSLPDARALAAHAQKMGADAVAAMAPCFFRPATTSDLVDFCAEIAAAAPDLPFYFYHMPSLTGVQVKVLDFLELAADRIPTLAGIKFTHEDLMDFARCVHFADQRYTILFGRDEMLLAGLAAGAHGAVGSTYNFAMPYYQVVLQSFRAGDMSRAQLAQLRAVELISIVAKYGGLPAQKAIMKMIGVDCGPVRRPLRPLTEAEYAKLREELDHFGLFAVLAGEQEVIPGSAA